MREKTVCFTGHRIIPSEKRASLFAHLTDVITSLLEAGIAISVQAVLWVLIHLLRKQCYSCGQSIHRFV